MYFKMSYVEQMQRTAMMSQSLNRNTTGTDEPQLKNQIQAILEMVQQQKDHSNRILNLNQNKIYSLEKEVNELREQLKQVSEKLAQINDKEVVKRSREALFNRQEKAPADRPIDRNGVCPKDVQISNIFNYSGRKF